MKEFEIILPKRVTTQPSPAVSDGGDCGACVLSGLTDIPVDKIYSEITGKIYPLSYTAMYDALWYLESAEKIESIITEHPSWNNSYYVSKSCFVWGTPSWNQSLSWGMYIYMAMSAGYYPICNVNNDAKGPFADTDHWIFLAGLKRESIPLKHCSGRSIKNSVLISNSSSNKPNEEWIEVNKFLKHWGGFNCFLAKC